MPNALVIVNTRSGGGRSRRVVPLVEEVIRGQGWVPEMVRTPSGSAAAGIVAQALGSRPDLVVAVGGDGTINGVLNGLVASNLDVPLGIVPSGTGNEIVRILGLPKDPAEAAEALFAFQPWRMDIGRVNGHCFFNVFGLGADVDALKSANRLRRYRLGRRRGVYHVAALLHLTSGLPRFPVRITAAGVRYAGEVLLVTAVNGRMYGEHLPVLPSPNLHDGLLDLYILSAMSRGRQWLRMQKLLRGRPLPELTVRRVEAARIELPGRTHAQVDGTLIEPASRFDLAVLPGRVRVLAPSPGAAVRRVASPLHAAVRRA